MRAITLAPVILAITLGATAAVAGPRVVSVDPHADASPRPTTEADFEKYRGYMFDLSDFADRKDFGAIAENLRRQLDIVDNTGLSPRVLDFFHTIPIVAAESDCLEEQAAIACYMERAAPNRGRRSSASLTIWDHDKQRWTNPDVVDLAADTGLGVIALRPTISRYAEEPVLVHELLHVYHAHLLPNGFSNKGIREFFAKARAKDLIEKNSYGMKNEKEFFAVTASIFLTGKGIHAPNTRAALKEKMPDYYGYLANLFGFDPDPSLPDKPAEAAATPVASAAPAPSASATPATPAAN
jgi:hypothetical protein